MNSAAITLGEGDTPVLSLTAIAKHFGIPEMWAKAEWLNPTGSYKDRIAVETIKDALRCGRRGWIGTSSGNGGASMSAYGARAGIPGFLCVAADAPTEKLQSIIPYGSTIFPMAQLGVREMDAIQEMSIDYNLKLSVTAYRYNPEGMSGAEMIGTELLDQGTFTHVYVPTGGGGLLVAIARGVRCGQETSPKLVCAQPQGCGPISRLLDGEIEVPVIDICMSTISGLQLPTPPDGELAAEAVRTTGGWGCLVADEDAWRIQDLLARQEGIFVEPASALAVAAMTKDFLSGRLTSADRPLAILTGTGLKDLRRFAPTIPVVSRHTNLNDLRGALQSAFR